MKSSKKNNLHIAGWESVSPSVFFAVTEQELTCVEAATGEIMQLSPEDQKLFAETLLHAPVPAPALLRAAKAYRKRVAVRGQAHKKKRP